MNEVESSAIRQWYSQPHLLENARQILATEDYLELEEYVQMTCLFPLSRHFDLPDYLKKEDGSPLFPHNLNPRANLTAWQDAIEVGWAVMSEHLGVTQDMVHQKIAREQVDDWDRFMKSVEQRKKERGMA